MNFGRRPPAWLVGLAAAVSVAALAAAFLALPPRVWPHPDWFDRGIRLYRDDVDLRVYFDYSSWVAVGGWPYTEGREQAYPPLAAAYFALPRLFFGDFEAYEKGFLGMNAALFGVLCGLSVWLLRRLGRPSRMVWLLLLPTSLYFSLWRFDVLAAALVTLLIWSVARRSYHLSLIFLAAGVLTKYFPAVYFIPLLMLIGSGRLTAADVRRLSRTLAILAVVAAGAAAALALTSGSGLFTETVVLHLYRKFEIGSLAAVLVMGSGVIGLPVRQVMQVLSLALILLQAAPPVLLLLRGKIRDQEAFIRGGLFILLPLVFFNRFYSQQWLLWITPSYLLVARRREAAALVAFDLLNFIGFPVLYGIDPYGWPSTAATLARSAVMGYLIFLNYREMIAAGQLTGFRMKRGGSPPASA